MLISQLGELHSEFFEVESGHFFVQMLGQEVHAQRITLGVVPQFDLGQHLVGEGGTHHEAAFVTTVILGVRLVKTDSRRFELRNRTQQFVCRLEALVQASKALHYRVHVHRGQIRSFLF